MIIKQIYYFDICNNTINKIKIASLKALLCFVCIIDLPRLEPFGIYEDYAAMHTLLNLDITCGYLNLCDATKLHHNLFFSIFDIQEHSRLKIFWEAIEKSSVQFHPTTKQTHLKRRILFINKYYNDLASIEIIYFI